MPAIWKTQQWPQDWKKSVFIPIPKKGNAKECSNYCTIALISQASKLMLKILQPGLQQYLNCELPDAQVLMLLSCGIGEDSWKSLGLVLEKVEEPEIKLPTSAGSSKKQQSSRKHLFLLYWWHQSLQLCGSQSTVENPERDGRTRPPDLPLDKSVCRSGSNS